MTTKEKVATGAAVALLLSLLLWGNKKPTAYSAPKRPTYPPGPTLVPRPPVSRPTSTGGNFPGILPTGGNPTTNAGGGFRPPTTGGGGGNVMSSPVIPLPVVSVVPSGNVLIGNTHVVSSEDRSVEIVIPRVPSGNVIIGTATVVSSPSSETPDYHVATPTVIPSGRVIIGSTRVVSMGNPGGGGGDGSRASSMGSDPGVPSAVSSETSDGVIIGPTVVVSMGNPPPAVPGNPPAPAGGGGDGGNNGGENVIDANALLSVAPQLISSETPNGVIIGPLSVISFGPPPPDNPVISVTVVSSNATPVSSNAAVNSNDNPVTSEDVSPVTLGGGDDGDGGRDESVQSLYD